jgi:hypothetical protein
LNEPYRSAFFSDSTSDMVSKSKLEILEDFFRAVLATAQQFPGTARLP